MIHALVRSLLISVLFVVPFCLQFQGPLQASGCELIVDPDDSFVEITAAINRQHGEEIERVLWFTINGTPYLAVGAGTDASGNAARLYRFEGVPGSDDEELIALTAGTNGFDTVHDPSPFVGVRGYCTFVKNDIDYLVLVGQPDGGVTSRLFRFNSALDRYDEVSGATSGFDVQHGGLGWRHVECLEKGGVLYLAAGGIVSGSVSTRLYTFNEYTETFNEVTSGMSGFDTQHGDTVYSLDWVVDPSDDTAYLVVSGDGNVGITARLYRLDESTPQLVEQVGAFDVQPDFAFARTESVNWVITDGKIFLATGGESAPRLRLYEFDGTYPASLTNISSAYDVNHSADVIVVEWIDIEGTQYLAMGGASDGGIVTRVYRFDAIAQTLTLQTILPTEQHGGDIESISLTKIGSSYYLAIGGEVDSSEQDTYGTDIVSRLYRFNLITGPYCPNEADLIITKTVDDASPTVGQTVTFTVIATNNGPNFAQGASVSDLLPSGLTFVSSVVSVGSYDSGSGVWSIGKMQPNQVETLTITATVDSAPDGTMITNTATVMDPYTDDPYEEANSASVTLTVTTESLTLVKSVDSSSPLEGDTIVYFIQVSTASVARGNISVQDLLPSGVTFVLSEASQGSFSSGSGIWTIGTLAANSMALLAITVTVDASTAGTTIINNASIVDAYGLDCYDVDLCSDSAVITVQPACSFDDVCLQDVLPTGLDFVSASPSVGNYNPYSGDWTIGTLAAGDSALLTLVAQAATGTAGQLLTNCVTIKDPYNLDFYSSNNMSCVDVQVRAFEADLFVDKSTTNVSPVAGSNVTFQVTVTNNGPGAVNDSFVTDVLPSEVTFVSSFATQGSYDSGSGIWTIGSLASGASQTLYIVVTVNGSESVGTVITNTAMVGDAYINDPYTSNNSATMTMTVAAPAICDLAITKTADKSEIDEGDNVVFTISVTNAQVN